MRFRPGSISNCFDRDRNGFLPVASDYGAKVLSANMD